MVLRSEAQPCPVSPRPWRKMMVAVCFPLGATTTGSDILDKRVSALTARLSPSPGENIYILLQL